MLVGAELFFKILSVGQFRPHVTGPIFQKTSLGWIASGAVSATQEQARHSLLSTDVELHNQLKPEPTEIDEIPEVRAQPVALSTQIKQPVIEIDRYSTFTRAQRVTAWCLRFINKLKPHSKDRLSNHGPLQPSELQDATTLLLKIDQQQHFPQDYTKLESKQRVKQTSKLLSLQPFMDDTGLMRVGGRLKNASISIDHKHPILLSPHSHLTHLIIKHEHLRSLHAAPQLLLTTLRQRYWTLKGRETVRKIVQQRSKWKKDETNIQVGQLVVVKEDNTPPLRWVTARVTEVHPGADGRVRVVTIRTSSGTYRRATNRLCVLPTGDAPTDLQ